MLVKFGTGRPDVYLDPRDLPSALETFTLMHQAEGVISLSVAAIFRPANAPDPSSVQRVNAMALPATVQRQSPQDAIQQQQQRSVNAVTLQSIVAEQPLQSFLQRFSAATTQPLPPATPPPQQHVPYASSPVPAQVQHAAPAAQETAHEAASASSAATLQNDNPIVIRPFIPTGDDVVTIEGLDGRARLAPPRRRRAYDDEDRPRPPRRRRDDESDAYDRDRASPGGESPKRERPGATGGGGGKPKPTKQDIDDVLQLRDELRQLEQLNRPPALRAHMATYIHSVVEDKLANLDWSEQGVFLPDLIELRDRCATHKRPRHDDVE